MSYKVEVLAVGEKNYTSNGLRFATDEEAQKYGADLSWRWFAVKDWRVVESPDPVNYTFKDGKLEQIKCTFCDNPSTGSTLGVPTCDYCSRQVARGFEES